MRWTVESAVGDAGAPYDGRAALYDRLVRSPLYNRLAWSASPRDYAGFARQAVDDAGGPLLEVAAGTAAATAAIHARSRRPTVLVDLSTGMLERAGKRIAAAVGDEAPSIRLVQADVFDLPFPPHGFETVLALGAAHLFDDLSALRGALVAQLTAGGRLYMTGLVAETRRGRRYLELLHRAGEAAAPRTATAMRRELGPMEFRVQGCMAYAVLPGPR